MDGTTIISTVLICLKQRFKQVSWGRQGCKKSGWSACRNNINAVKFCCAHLLKFHTMAMLLAFDRLLARCLDEICACVCVYRSLIWRWQPSASLIQIQWAATHRAQGNRHCSSSAVSSVSSCSGCQAWLQDRAQESERQASQANPLSVAACLCGDQGMLISTV